MHVDLPSHDFGYRGRRTSTYRTTHEPQEHTSAGAPRRKSVLGVEAAPVAGFSGSHHSPHASPHASHASPLQHSSSNEHDATLSGLHPAQGSSRAATGSRGASPDGSFAQQAHPVISRQHSNDGPVQHEPHSLSPPFAPVSLADCVISSPAGNGEHTWFAPNRLSYASHQSHSNVSHLPAVVESPRGSTRSSSSSREGGAGAVEQQGQRAREGAALHGDRHSGGLRGQSLRHLFARKREIESTRSSFESQVSQCSVGGTAAVHHSKAPAQKANNATAGQPGKWQDDPPTGVACMNRA
jgi:hypothetical protein